MSYEAVIGLEIHAELATKTKLFCSCKNEFGGEPNSRICPVCTGQPGVLPSTNREAIMLSLRAALAFGCDINKTSAQCRKHYFYPDLPKGYQISQRETPIGINGCFEFISDGEVKSVGIRQIHIEEDAGKLVHFEDGATGIDYNRAGVPLIEIVTEPQLGSSRDARAFLEAVRMRLLRAGISDCKMEQGSLRCDVNVSLRKVGETEFRERVEMKNINTFSGAERAIEYEIARQAAILEGGGEVLSQTRKWDDERRESRLMRTKETAIDYKFMPEPDIPSYDIDDLTTSQAGKNLPESDVERAVRYNSLGVSQNDCAILMFDIELSKFFDECAHNTDFAGECAKLLVGDVSAILAKEGIVLNESKLLPSELSNVAKLICEGKINRQSAKMILQKLITSGGSAEKIAQEFMRISDEAIILSAVKSVLEENPKAVCDYKNGKTSSLTYLIGKCMRKLHGRADTEVLNNILINKLQGETKNEF